MPRVARVDTGATMVRHARVLLAAVLLLSGCGDGDTPTSPTAITPAPAGVTALERSIQDEYRAETTYQAVINDLGPLQPFVNVLTAEQRHSATIAQLLTVRGLAVPPNPWTLATVPHYGTATEACRAAATAERANVAMYDELLRLDLPADVRQAFTNIRAASLLNHLPAFERCS